MKLTPKKIRELSREIEKHLDECGYDGPVWETINLWIADWCKNEMNNEAYSLYEKTTNLSEGFK
jgi:hypothetical protein